MDGLRCGWGRHAPSADVADMLRLWTDCSRHAHKALESPACYPSAHSNAITCTSKCCYMHIQTVLHAHPNAITCTSKHCSVHIQTVLHAHPNTVTCTSRWCYMHIQMVLHAHPDGATCTSRWCYMQYLNEAGHRLKTGKNPSTSGADGCRRCPMTQTHTSMHTCKHKHEHTRAPGADAASAP